MKKKIDLSDYTKEDLIYLNHLIKERFDHLHQIEQYQAFTNYKVGDRVCFQTMEGRSVRGTIIRLNKKTVSMIEDGNQMNWKVWPSLLTKLHIKDKSSTRSNVINLDRP